MVGPVVPTKKKENYVKSFKTKNTDGVKIPDYISKTKKVSKTQKSRRGFTSESIACRTKI